MLYLSKTDSVPPSPFHPLKLVLPYDINERITKLLQFNLNLSCFYFSRSNLSPSGKREPEGTRANSPSSNRGEISFNFQSDFWLDVSAFEAGENELFQGNVLEGLYLRNAIRFEEWLC